VPAMSEESRGYRRTWIDHTVEVEAGIGDVHALLTDIDGWPAWTPGLTRISRKAQGPWKAGQKFTMHIKPASFHPPLPVPCETFEVSAKRLVWGGGIPGSQIRHSFDLSELGPKRTRVHQLEYATNLLAIVTRIAEPGIYKHDLRWQNALRDKFASK